MDDLVGGRWRHVDAGAEIGDEKELRDLVALFFQRHHETGNADALTAQGLLDGGVVPAFPEPLQRLHGARVGVLERAQVEPLESLLGVPVLGDQRVPWRLLVNRLGRGGHLRRRQAIADAISAARIGSAGAAGKAQGQGGQQRETGHGRDRAREERKDSHTGVLYRRGVRPSAREIR
ncbi:MAG: hypothetical protein AW09_002123 [Candidatus Accumulibacter phosphatis]|uniref:Uncharacterized protein n=1 Tax=Candidatus Accumulibacter phosphatis TaxID=327160 RepID=A0A080LXV5_9PROT|nr:MAG: hypothetical protein AW09_002123 [Candidatus Accumulibacter phosphatis]